MALELAWGRLRRAYLRALRPGYVRRMLGLRQGQCPGCRHDVIDPRDLKFYRNVCGYWFRPEDDPFRWRDRLGVARVGLAEIICLSLVYAALAGALGLAFSADWVGPSVTVALAVLLTLLWFQTVWFFRDPRRNIPKDPGLLLSPADGTVTDVGEVEAPGFPGGRAFRVGIFLSVFNVHVNRSPRAARVRGISYCPGKFLNAMKTECSSENEAVTIDLEDAATGQPVRVKQIAGAIARRIVCWLRPDEELQAGQHIGMIKFGSRTEVIVPVDSVVEALARVGQKVKGGETALLRLAAR
jgi:phosphatidylserine decarboxylase